MRPEEVVAFVRARESRSSLSTDSARFWHSNAAIRVREDGLWELDRGDQAVRRAREAVLERVAMSRRWARRRPSLADFEEQWRRLEAELEASARSLASLHRVIVHAFPAPEPEVVVLLDVNRREIQSYTGGEIASATARLAEYDLIAALRVGGLLATLNFAPGARRLVELGPPQKTVQLNKRGRTLRLHTALLVTSSCGISRPFGDEKTLHGYLRDGDHTRLRRRLEADAKSLHALYQYGRLHGALRVRWGYLDRMIPAPWIYPGEMTLGQLKRRALEQGARLQVVTGPAPGWSDPWSRARPVHVVSDSGSWRTRLVGEHGEEIFEADVQLARIAGEGAAAVT
jgi:hypothetical protein